MRALLSGCLHKAAYHGEPMKTTDFALLLEPRDLWVGLYWNKVENKSQRMDIYICIIPCLPLRISRYLTWML